MTTSILLADRDRGLAEALRRCLVHRGYNVHAVINGLDCMEQLRKLAPDVLILDPEILWGGGAGILDWLVDEAPMTPPLVILADSPREARISDSLQMRIDFRLDRPTGLHDILTFVNHAEEIIQRTQSQLREAVDKGIKVAESTSSTKVPG